MTFSLFFDAKLVRKLDYLVVIGERTITKHPASQNSSQTHHNVKYFYVYRIHKNLNIVQYLPLKP